MSEISVAYENDVPDTNQRYAGFWMRFWAYFIDVLVIFSLNGILLSPFKFINDGIAISIGFWTVTGIVGSIVFYAYFLLMTKFLGQTIGKMILGIRVIREDEKPLRWSDLIFREVVGRFIYRVFTILMLLYVVVGFTEQKQGLHDMIGNTRVVFDR
ncbi:RDD family protein [Ornithinibacillus bavariensis]|uniref:Membrane protein YteJ n=1 Tax=Ornithinibacillus bavariensis TaxID=545502 RepID=A0A920C4D8_9BACI|nr:RDD family protein [Ornithinibacillus bavariensis]GIO25601.1 putative membrane protein YteJ [Ornithinibacillus bavariensis]HAM79995.1 RDD family protein [Ornithinibacillus sp.]